MMKQPMTPAGACHAAVGACLASDPDQIASKARSYRKTLILSIAMLAALTSMAASADVRVENAWSRATPPGIDRGAGYMTLHNAGDETRTLTGANAEGAKRIEIHESREVDGQMRMEALPDGVTLEPGATVELAPMSIHLMIMGLDKRMARGETFLLTLEFRNGDTLDTELTIRAPDSSADQHSH